MCVKQCMGTTKKGARCLIKVHGGEFCHYHVPHTSPAKTRPATRREIPQNMQFSRSHATNSSSAPVTPRKSKSAVHVASKSYTTTTSHAQASFTGSPARPSDRMSDPIKYNNLDRPTRPEFGGKQKSIDYNAIASSPRCRYSPKVELAIQPGYIYVYTLSSFLSKHADGGWIQTRNLSRDKRHQDKWVDVDMRRSHKMLVKVGMTTKTPAVRIAQWEAKCNHKLQCLYPGSHPHLGKSGLSRMFSGLSLKENKEAKKYSAYVENHHGFFVPRNILHCEQQIHQILKSKFGRGEIHCTGCYDKPAAPEESQSFLDMFRQKDDPSAKTDYNIHNEWFPIPRKKLGEVFSIINGECTKYMP
ncbi:hypothetical protein OXX59_001701 [Metschnikowia pulcherrima]